MGELINTPFLFLDYIFSHLLSWKSSLPVAGPLLTSHVLCMDDLSLICQSSRYCGTARLPCSWLCKDQASHHRSDRHSGDQQSRYWLLTARGHNGAVLLKLDTRYWWLVSWDHRIESFLEFVYSHHLHWVSDCVHILITNGFDKKSPSLFQSFLVLQRCWNGLKSTAQMPNAIFNIDNTGVTLASSPETMCSAVYWHWPLSSGVVEEDRIDISLSLYPAIRL